MMTDEKIVELYWSRNETAIALTKDRYEKYLYSIAYRIINIAEDSEESVNDTYLGAWNSMPPNRPANLKTYLGRLTRNITLNRVRKNNAQKRGSKTTQEAFEELSEVLEDKADTELSVEQKMLAEYIQRFLGELSRGDRIIFLMKYWNFYSIKEISSKCGYSQSKVKMSLKRP